MTTEVQDPSEKLSRSPALSPEVTVGAVLTWASGGQAPGRLTRQQWAGLVVWWIGLRECELEAEPPALLGGRAKLVELWRGRCARLLQATVAAAAVRAEQYGWPDMAERFLQRVEQGDLPAPEAINRQGDSLVALEHAEFFRLRA